MSTEHVADSIPTGYKQTEVGVIPEDWIVTTVGQIAEVKTGPFGSALHERDYVDDGTPIITVEHLGERGVLHTNLPMVSDADKLRLNAYSLRSGDIVFSRVGSVDRNALIKATEDKWLFSGRLLRVRLKQRDIDSQYVSFLFHSETFKQRVRDVAVGQTMASINTQILMGVKMVLPPALTEQEAIATALSDTDALIESLEQLIAKKRQIKQGAMQELLTGKRRLPGFSGEWQTKLLGDLFEFNGGLSASRDQLSTEGYCYLHYGDIHTSNKTYIDVKLDVQNIPKLNISLKKVSFTSLLESGDVVFVDASEDDEGASKHVVVFNEDKIPFISGLHTIVAKSKTNELDYHYRRYCFQTRDVKQQFRFFAVGTKVTGISKTNIAKITLPVPPFPEQTAIATILSDMDAEITTLEEKLAKTRQIKQGMMQELLTGRIRLV